MNILKKILIKQNRVSWMLSYVSCSKKFNIVKSMLRKRLENKYHIIIGSKASVGREVYVPHPQNIIIGGHVKMGERCTIYHDVTLGQKRNEYPLVGDDVVIYPGAKIIGGIRIGNKAVIGANAVVINDIPERMIVAGIPASQVGIRGDTDEFY